ncbi:hypothetical protein EU546_02375 [Candidatus Thorarchaeota archaeon]|nr:MAG: hypothetical protein EU546_02375 [Candidatus Thorarchaeota archaeon]
MQTVWLFGATLGVLYALAPTLLLVLWICDARRNASKQGKYRMEALPGSAKVRFLVSFLPPFLVVELLALFFSAGLSFASVPVLALMIGLHQLEAVTIMYTALIVLERYPVREDSQPDSMNEP